MGSFKNDDRNSKHSNRRGSGAKRRGPLGAEHLEARTLLSGAKGTNLFVDPTADVSLIKTGPLAKAGQYLGQLYTAFQKGGEAYAPWLAEAKELILFDGDMVGVDAYGKGDFATFERTLRRLGMRVVATDERVGIVEGYLPVSQIRAAAQFAQTRNLSPSFIPFVRQQGIADNQADIALQAVQARTQFNVDGTGVVVGVLSDSVDQFAGGLADSQATGDLPPDDRINVLKDEPATGNGRSDEGRAMLELIYDIAPGANFAYHTAFDGLADFANGIRRLANEADADVIVDDIGYLQVPVFQDDIVSVAVNEVTANNNAVYLSAFGNAGDGGYESDFRAASATIANIGTGTFQDFDPGPGVDTTLPITVTGGGLAALSLWWDDPWYTGQAASDVDIYILDAAGTVVAQAVGDNRGSATPQEIIGGLAAGSYDVVVQATAGAVPTRIRVMDPFGGANLEVNRLYGFTGNTFYPSSLGQPQAATAIGVGAVPFFNAPAYSAQTPVRNEDFSSFGPAVILFDASGNRLPSRELRLKPDVSAIDATNTTFFGQDIPEDPDTFPNFFGTSAAAPNLAAVAALMREMNPGATTVQINDAFKQTALPLNGSPGGFDFQGGFGLVNAAAALGQLSQLQVIATTPASGATVDTVPRAIIVDFSKPIDPASVDSGDITFVQLPAGLLQSQVVVGTPTVISPTRVSYPITINAPADVLANGLYAYTLRDGAVVAADGSAVQETTRIFTLADTQAPTVVNTIVSGRIIVVEFSEAMRESTLGRQSIMLVHTGGTGELGRPENVVVTDDPNAIFFYDAATNRAIFDLRSVPQSVLPSDIYYLVVTDEARDVVGQRLDGNFTGTFPSGDGAAGGTFVQELGGRLLTAPQIVQFGLTADSDTGIRGDQTTNLRRPQLAGAVVASFPGTNAGLTVAVQFIQEHDGPGEFDLAVGQGGRGFTGTPDLILTTSAAGGFTIDPPFDLRDGFHRVRLVVVGASDQPPLPGLGTVQNFSFRVDTTKPLVVDSTIQPESRISSLREVTLRVADPVAPANVNDILAVPTQFDAPALNPATANNLSNYSLINLGPDRRRDPNRDAAGNLIPAVDDVDFSQFIRTARFTSTSNRTIESDPFTGRIDLTIAEGLPAGRYALVARTNEQTLARNFSGLTDAAGNALNSPSDIGQQGPPNDSFVVFFNLQAEPAFITGFEAFSPSNETLGEFVSTPVRSFYETPTPEFAPRAEAAPTFFQLDFSSTLEPRDYNGAVRLVRSTNSAAGSQPDGDFGTGQVGLFTEVPGVSVDLVNSVVGATSGQSGFQDRLVVRIAAGTTLPADDYRLVIANEGSQVIRDIFGNVVDLEFLGNERPTGGDYEVFMPDGTYRDGLTGDGVAGGSFVTGFTVVPAQRRIDSNGDGVIDVNDRVRGNIIFARPDYVDDPFLDGDDPDGSLERPFPTLVAEAVPNSTNDGFLNSQSNFGTGFNARFDRNANGRFDRSAFVEADEAVAEGRAAGRGGPVVIVTLPGVSLPVPGTTETRQQPFVVAPRAGLDVTDPRNDASASVPENTTLVLGAGTTMKLFNAAIFVQNQGSALQIRGGTNPTDRVLITSLLDDSVGGDTNDDGTDTRPSGGDWGGIVFRNFNDVIDRGPDAGDRPFPVDGDLGASGADDTRSYVNFGTLRYGGGTVPQTLGIRYDSITLLNSRPSITNSTITDTSDSNGLATGTQAAISADLDSLREDAIARGPLVRRMTLTNNSINGILLTPTVGFQQTQQTDAQTYAEGEGGARRDFVIDDPLPYVLASQLVLGQGLLRNRGGVVEEVTNRLYVQPGMMLKARPGASVALLNPRSSLNVGDRTYLDQFDINPNVSPEDLGFRPNSRGDAKPLFTSLYDDAAQTMFVDPNTGDERIIVPANVTDNSTTNEAPGPNSVTQATRWGGVSITPGAVAVIDEAEFRYGGGQVVTPFGTLPPRQVLDLTNDVAGFTTRQFASSVGSNVSITNNDFFDNQDTPIVIEPNGLLAADPQRPLALGNPFIRGNLMQRNDIDGLTVKVFQGIIYSTVDQTNFVYVEPITGANLSVDSVWDDTDVTHVLRGTITLAGHSAFTKPFPPASGPITEPEAAVTLTLQSQLPDTVLANGEVVARPGESLITKLLSDQAVVNPGPGTNVDPDLPNPGSNILLDVGLGAGFSVGFDNGVDPPADPVIDFGYGSQLRIVGIGANETTGQQRVPVVITSLRDATVGPTVRGQSMANSFNLDRQQRPQFAGALSTPAPGDAGIIGFGGNMLTDYNLLDPRGGSLIDNADIRFLHRIEFQGGNVVDLEDTNADDAISNIDFTRVQRLGLSSRSVANNSANSMTISNSNLATFRDAAVFVQPGFDLIWRLPTNAFDRGAGLGGQPTNLYFLNNTVSDAPVGLRINSGNYNDNFVNQQSPTTTTILHNTFFNVGVAIRTQGPTYSPNPLNDLSHNYFIAMNNIFEAGARGADPTATAVRVRGMAQVSELLFNVFNGYSTPVDILNTSPLAFLGNNSPIFAAPQFRDAANGNFFLQPNSAGIDSALSEQGPVALGDAIYPVFSEVVDPRTGEVDFVRNDIGRTNESGGASEGLFLYRPDPREIITLPGTPGRPFDDQYIPVRDGQGGTPGRASNIATYQYRPIAGERDLEGFLRQDDPGSPNLGFGSRPFFDIGAREFRRFTPPVVTTVGAPDADGDGTNDGVFATILDQNGEPVLINLYTIGGVAGTNQAPQQIAIQLDKRVDPSTVNELTVLLEASGGDGIFDNRNSTRERAINLSGKVTFDAQTRRILINLGSDDVRFNDLYRITLVGTGSNVIRDPQGTALDGENLDGNGLPRPLPSGEGFPGGNFVLTFSVDTTPPSVVPGTFVLAASSDSGARDGITNNNRPTFEGTITDVFPPVNPLIGALVVLDIDVDGDGTFDGPNDRPNAGTARTDAQGQFQVTVGTDGANSGLVTNTDGLPDTAFNTGPDGRLDPAGGDDSGYSMARVRIIDVSNNESVVGAPGTVVGFVVDTTGPRITAVTPDPNSVATVNGGTITVSFTADENLLETSLRSANGIIARGAGLDGVFGTTDDRTLTVDVAGLIIEYLNVEPKGPVRVTFDVSGITANDVYRVSLTSSITDIATNGLDGEFNGALPSGNGQPGGDFNLDLIVFSPGQSRIIYVSPFGTAAGTGSRDNPYQTIAQGLAVAAIGDTVGVLPGTYAETVNLKSLVKVVGAGESSTNSTLARGTAQQSIIRPVASTSGETIGVRASGVLNLSDDLRTELASLTVASPLSGVFTGSILDSTVGIDLDRASILIRDTFVINSGIGVRAVTTDGSLPNAVLQSVGLIGNITGLHVDDTGSTSASRVPLRVVNNTIAYNTMGIVQDAAANAPVSLEVVNSIFWQNRNRSTGSGGTAIQGSVPNAIDVRQNLFSQNGSNPDSPIDDIAGTPIDPSTITTSPATGPLGNFTGEPAFASPRDPRPEFDGPTLFLLDGNFSLTVNSAAIDNAINSLAPTLDSVGRPRINTANRGAAGFGPADLGILEYFGPGATSDLPSNVGGDVGNDGLDGPVLFSFNPNGSNTGAPVPTGSSSSYTVEIATSGGSLGAGQNANAGPARRAQQANRQKNKNAPKTVHVPKATARPFQAFLNRFGSRRPKA